jgi:hypothetical protein
MGDDSYTKTLALKYLGEALHSTKNTIEPRM